MKNKKKILYSFIVSLIMIIIAVPFTVHADWDWSDFFGTKDSDIPKILEFLHNDWIRYTDFLGAILQSFLGGIVKLLLSFVSLVEGLIPDTFSLFDLLKDAGLNEFYTSIMKGLFYSILVLMIVWIGIRVIIQHNPPKFKSVGVNVVIMIGLLGGLNELMADMQSMATDFYKGSVEQGKAKEGLAWDIVKDNTADLLYLSQVGFDSIKKENSKEPKNNLSKEEFLQADLSDLLTLKVIEDISKEGTGMAAETNYLTYKISHTGKEQTVSKIEKASMFNPFKDSFESGYKRYPMQFFTIFWSLLALGVAYLFTLFVFVITIFELVMKKLVAPFVMVTDIDSGQKTKMMIQDIGQGFLTIAFTGLSLRFFTISVNFVANKDLNPVLYVVVLVCLTIALIKGSNTILKYFGVDVGLKEGMNGFLATVGGLSLAKRAGEGMKNMFSGARETASSKQTRDDTPKRSQMNLEDKENSSNDKDNKKSGITPKNFMKNTGAALSYATNRGVPGMMNDAGNMVVATMSNAVDKGKEKASGVTKGLSGNVQDTINDFKEGQAEGKQKAQENNDRQLLNKLGKDIHNNANSGEDQNVSPKMGSVSNANKQQMEQGNSQSPGQTSQDEILRSKQMMQVEKQQVEQGNTQASGQALQDENLRRMQTMNVEKKQVEQGNSQASGQASQDENLRRIQTMNVEKKQVEQGNPQASGQASQDENLRRIQTMYVEKKQVEQGNPTVTGGTARAENQHVMQETKIENKAVQGANPTVSGGTARAENQHVMQETKIENKAVQGANPTVSGGTVRAESQRAVQET
ncbi:pLS20_p028 family conjugation system transmembrane protein, partial [Bacillus cereus]